MKKIIPILFIIFMFYFLTNEQEILIPKDAIRFRIIANSNKIKDQELKLKVKSSLEEDLNTIMQNAKTSSEAKQLLKNALPTIRKKVSQYTSDNKVELGQNYFPEKKYHGLTYEEGTYDSLVITLGQGNGENWWCVMFPPLCLLEAKNNNSSDVEYKLLIKEILDKYQS